VNIAGTPTWKPINSISVSPTSPANNVIGQVWYDNTNNLLKISNGFLKDSSGNVTTQVDWIIVNNPVKKITQSNPSSNYTLTISDLGNNINTTHDITLSSTIGEGFYATVFNKSTTAVNVTWSTPLVITVNGDTTVKTSPVTIPPKSLITIMYMSNTEVLLKP